MVFFPCEIKDESCSESLSSSPWDFVNFFSLVKKLSPMLLHDLSKWFISKVLKFKSFSAHHDALKYYKWFNVYADSYNDSHNILKHF